MKGQSANHRDAPERRLPSSASTQKELHAKPEGAVPHRQHRDRQALGGTKFHAPHSFRGFGGGLGQSRISEAGFGGLGQSCISELVQSRISGISERVSMARVSMERVSNGAGIDGASETQKNVLVCMKHKLLFSNHSNS